MPFSHDIAGGQGNLVVPAVKSPNYVHGVSGWSINKDGSAEFQDVVLPAGTAGTTVTFSATAPTSPSDGDVWYDTAEGLEASVWNGTEWVAYQIGTGAIAPGSITSGLVDFTATSIGGITTYVQGTAPAGTINAGSLWIDTASGNALYQYESGAWTLYQFGSGSIAANSITASQIAANTITASQLAAGIVYAGIINGTTVNAATFTGSTFMGTNWIENEYGQFAYTGTPAAGNLFLSIANTAGNDAAWTSGAGNNYHAGINIYGTGAGAVAGMSTYNSGADAYLYAAPGGATHMITPPQIWGDSGNTGTSTEYTGAVLYSGSNSSGFDAQVTVLTGNNDGSSSGSGQLVSNGDVRLSWDDGGVHVYSGMSVWSAGGVQGNPDISLFDNTSATNANSATQLATIQWSIPENDAQVGTVYVVEVPLAGKTATSGPQTLGFKPYLGSAVVTTSNGDTIGGTAMAAATGFTAKMRLTMKVRTTGASGTVDIFMEGGYAQESNIQAGSGTNSGFMSSQATGVAFNTTTANTIAIVTVWGASSASQTITSYGSVFTRKGP